MTDWTFLDWTFLDWTFQTLQTVSTPWRQRGALCRHSAATLLTAVLLVRLVAAVVGAVADLAQVHAALAAALHGSGGTLGSRDLD